MDAPDRRVHPAEIKIEDIRLKLGSAWIPAPVITRFARETLQSSEVRVLYHPGIGEFAGDSWEVRHGNNGAAFPRGPHGGHERDLRHRARLRPGVARHGP